MEMGNTILLSIPFALIDLPFCAGFLGLFFF